VAPSAAGGEVRVRIRREDDALHVVVEDDGPGIDGDPEYVIGSGVGLGNLRDRITHLYDGEGTLHLENRPEGGLRVTARLPWRTAAAP